MELKRMYLSLLLLQLPVFFSYGIGADSLGIKSEENGVYVMHQVDAKETLYSLSKRYGASVASIVENNQITDNNLSVGLVLKIPWSHGLVHKVKTGETLYSLSKMYQIPVEKIKRLNQLTSNELKTDMSLILLTEEDPIASKRLNELPQNAHIVGEKETLYSISKKYSIELNDLKNWNHLNDNRVKAGDTLVIYQPQDSGQLPKDTPQPDLETTSETSGAIQLIQPADEGRTNVSRDVKPVKETGIAAVIDGTTDTRKYLALHATAPVGTIMRVRNEMTNLSVFVRVVGKLPATGTNNNVLIRLSQAAQQALGALDGKFRVELSYVPNQ